MSEASAEVPISEARDHFADLVNQAAYGGKVFYLTRHGRRMAVITSTENLEADRAQAAEQAVAEVARRWWAGAANLGPDIQAEVRRAIDKALAAAEDATDAALITAAEADESEPVSWKALKDELGL